MRRLAPALVLLALALMQLPWVFCPCEECGGFAPSTGAAPCLGGHAQGHGDHDDADHDHGGHDHADHDHADHDHADHDHADHDHGGHDHADHGAHEHAVTMLAGVPAGGAVALASVDAGWADVLAPAAEAIATDARPLAVEVADVPWDGRPRAASPDSGIRLLL